MTTQPQWSEEFDKEFKQLPRFWKNYGAKNSEEFIPAKNVKAFITRLLTTQSEQHIAILEGMKKGVLPFDEVVDKCRYCSSDAGEIHGGECEYIQLKTYNTALTEAQERIKS